MQAKATWNDRTGETRALLTAAAQPRQVLLSLVHTLDLRLRAAKDGGDEATVAFIEMFLARTTVAAAELALASTAPNPTDAINTTVAAARAYIEQPSAAAYTDLFRAATASYPFGPGDGCMAVHELGQCKTPGAGCQGSVGFIAAIGSYVGDEALLRALRASLLPWLSPLLRWHPEPLAIVRFPADAAIPALPRGFFSLTRTADELSLVLDEASVPHDAPLAEGGWIRFSVVGPLAFSMVGVLSGLSTTLAQAGVSIFVISTFDTDVILVRRDDQQRAAFELQVAGYRFVDEYGGE